MSASYTPEPAEIVAFLKQTAFFKDLKNSELQVIGGVTRVLAFEEGAAIVTQGEQASEFFIVAEGRAQVVVTDPVLGTETTLLELGAYDSFGEMSLLISGRRSATVRALTRTMCVVLSGADFEAILSEMPQAAIPLSRYLASRLADQGHVSKPIELKPEHFDRDVYGMLSPSVAERLNAVPLKLEGGVLSVALTHPNDPGTLEELRRAVPGLQVRPLACDADNYRRFLREVIRPALAGKTVKITAGAAQVRFARGTGAPPWEALLGKALASQASELRLGHGKCWLRCPEALQEIPVESDFALLERQARQVCGLSEEQPSPWSGSACLELANSGLIDLHFSALPTNRGELIAVSLVPADRSAMSLEELIPSEALVGHLRSALRRPGGLVLVCGAARSGKTATLYAALRDLGQRSPELLLASVEDEIEWTLEGVTQCQAAGAGYPTMIAAVIRQLPDLLMIGEIRDSNTARLALETALTSCSVLTSMYAADSTSALVRLGHMGCPPYLIGSAVELVVGQALLRAVCPHCREPYAGLGEQLTASGILSPEQATEPLYHGRGCSECRETGYLGQVPALEMLKIEEPIRLSLARGDDAVRLRQVARECGALSPFRQSVAALLLAGRTSPTEALRLFAAEA